MNRRTFLQSAAAAVAALIVGKAVKPARAREPKCPGHACPLCASVDIDLTKERATHVLADCRNCGVSFMKVLKGEDAGKIITFRGNLE